jgi:protein ImuB
MYACLYVPNANTAQRAALLRCAESFSPAIEPGGESVTVDVRGLRTLMGSPRDIAMRMAAALQTAGLRGNVVVASNPHAAVAAARGIEGITVIAPGDETRALARLPLSLLNPSEELADTLQSWGIRTFGDLSRLPAIGLAERLGDEGARLHALSRGLSPGPLVPLQEAPVFEASMDIEHGLDSLEPLAFLLGRLLNEVCSQLVHHGLAATEITVRLALEDAPAHTRTIRLPFASTDTGTLLKLLQYDLAAHPPQAPILRVVVHAEPSPQRRLQGGLFRPVAPEAEKLELTLARLSAVVGEGNVGSPELLDTHRPDAFRINRFVARADAPLQPSAPLVTPPPLAIRLYRPPLPAEVAVANGTPQWVRARGIRGDVIGYAGPWRTSGDWWRSDSWSRDEWDLALSTGTLYRVFRTIPDRWFVGGNYD